LNTAVANNGTCDSNLLQTNSLFPLRSSESQGIFEFVSNLKKNKEQKFTVTNLSRALFSDKARCGSQSECALYGNFTIKVDIKLPVNQLS